MVGKILGIKISEFIGTNSKTGEPTNGNYVSECYAADKDFETITGVKLEVPVTYGTAFDRNPRSSQSLPDDVIPF